MAGQIIFIIGGARSGKSSYATYLAQSYAHVVFLATAEAGDSEMTAKIARHRSERPPHWHTLEAPRGLAGALATMPSASVVVLDCVTLWVSNLLLAEHSSWQAAEAELDALMDWQRAAESDLIIVSNEVGWGIVPADAVTRTYREWLGWFNQRIAAAADQVFLLVAGLPIELKALTTRSALAAGRS